MVDDFSVQTRLVRNILQLAEPLLSRRFRKKGEWKELYVTTYIITGIADRVSVQLGPNAFVIMVSKS